MNRNLIITAAAVLFFVIIAVLLYVLLHKPASAPSAPSTSFPQAATGTSGDTVSITLTDGTSAVIPNFAKTKPALYSDPQNGYVVAGAGQGADFLITYSPNDSGFLVTLLKEPLGASRNEAENALRSELKLSDEEMCKLPNTQVGTVNWVNAQYAGMSLGLSFCPGAVQLPF